MTTKELIDFIGQERKRKNVSRRELAKECGMIKQTLEKIEKGKRMPRIDTYIRIINALGCTITVKEG